MKRSLTLICLLISVFIYDSFSQNPNVLIELESEEGGILIPRMTETKRNLIFEPTEGLMIYQTTNPAGFYFYTGSTWEKIGGNDGDDSNEIQTISRTGTTVTLSKGGSTFQDSVNVYSAGDGINIEDNVISAVQSQNEHFVGENFGGGIVFYTNDDGTHGLICSMIDLSTNQSWSNIIDAGIGISAQSDWDGETNSTSITNQAGHTSSSAQLSIDYSNVDYGSGILSDWYLPALDELSLLYHAKYQVNKALASDGNASTTALLKDYYWSSSELNTNLAWQYSLNNGVPNDESKSSGSIVRAIRAF